MNRHCVDKNFNLEERETQTHHPWGWFKILEA